MSPYVYRRTEDIARTPLVPYIFRAEIPHGTKKRPRQQDYNPELCGTTRGYWQHRRYGQQQCAGCAQAQSEYTHDYRERKQQEGSG